MDAPSSAHTRPSQTASAAPRTQPRSACGPCMATTTSGRVMNGPTPIMSSMFRATALPRPMPRISWGDSPGLVVSVVTDGWPNEGPDSGARGVGSLQYAAVIGFVARNHIIGAIFFLGVDAGLLAHFAATVGARKNFERITRGGDDISRRDQ